MPGRSSLNANVIDTEQVFDDSISYAKLNTACKSTITGLDSTAMSTTLAAAKVADKTVCKYASVSCYATGTVVYPICTVPGVSIVTDVITVTEAAITPGGTGTQTIGDASAADGYLTDANIAKTLNAVSGEDPATRGVYLWVPGVQSSTVAAIAGAQSTIGMTGTNSTLTFGGSGENTGGSNSSLALSGSNSTISLSSGGNWAVTTYGHPRVKVYLTDTVINCTAVKGTNTAGTLGVYVFYTKVVPSV
jgi:hypothetical protein